MNILFLTDWFPNRFDDQLGIFVKKHALAAAVNHNVFILYIKRDDNIDSTSEHILNVSENYHELTVYYKNSIPYFSYYIATSIGLKKLLNNQRPDFIHINIPGFSSIPIFLNRFRNIPVIVTEHASHHIGYGKISFVKKLLIKKVFKKAACVTSVSKFLAEHIENNYSIKKIELLPNIVEARKSDHRKDKIDKKFKVLMVGDLRDEIKNISDVIQVILELKENNYSIRLDIIGGGEDEEKLRNSCKNAINTFIFFHGRKNNEIVLEAINHCDILITNSRIETFSITTLEAIMAGKPVIVTKCGGPEEYMNESFGIMIDPDSKQQLKESIINMMSSFENYDKIKMSKFVEDNYSHKAISEKLNNLYIGLKKE